MHRRWLLDAGDDLIDQQADHAEEQEGRPDCETLIFLILEIQLAECFVFPFEVLHFHETLLPFLAIAASLSRYTRMNV